MSKLTKKEKRFILKRTEVFKDLIKQPNITQAQKAELGTVIQKYKKALKDTNRI